MAAFPPGENGNDLNMTVGLWDGITDEQCLDFAGWLMFLVFVAKSAG